MSKKFNFFFDIDGTLIKGGIIPTDSVLDSLRYARSKGCRVFLNTGRTKATLPPALTSLDCIDGILCGCGTYVEFGGKAMLERYIDTKEITRIMSIFDQTNLPSSSCITFEGVDTVFYHGVGFVPYADIEFHEVKYTQEVSERFDDAKINKFCLYPLTDRDDEFLEPLRDKYSTTRCNNYWEIIPDGLDKGKAIMLTEELLGLDHSLTVAVGDSANDATMFAYAPLSVAMGNAKDEIKAMCDMVTDTVQNDGVAKMIYELVK